MASSLGRTNETQTLCRACGIPLLHDSRPCVACSDRPRAWQAADFIGPYRVDRSLGTGSTGTTYLCIDDVAGDRLVVKALDAHTQPNNAERCVRESRMAGRLIHENVVRIRSVGRARGVPFVASELVDGRSVASLVAERARAPREALLVARGVAVALETALHWGFHHRAIKPTNVFVTTAGVVKLGDFGHVPPRGGNAENGAANEPYAAPEHTLGLQADQRADIYSLGLVAFHMLTGLVPRPIDSMACLAISGETQIPSLLEVRPDLHAAVAFLVERMTNLEPHARHQSYTELIAHIDDALRCLSFADQLRFGLDAAAPATNAAADDAEADDNDDTLEIPATVRVATETIAGACLGIACMLALTGKWPAVAASDLAGNPGRGEVAATEPTYVDEAIEAIATNATSTETFRYAMGSAEALESFAQVGADSSVGRSAGGRLLTPRGQRYAVVHDRLLDGQLDAALSFVLAPDSEIALVLRTDDGRRVKAAFRASRRDDPVPSVTLAVEGDDVATATPYLRPDVPHFVKLSRSAGQTRIVVDGSEVMRARTPMSGRFRLGLEAVHGGAELRHLRFRAAEVS